MAYNNIIAAFRKKKRELNKQDDIVKLKELVLKFIKKNEEEITGTIEAMDKKGSMKFLTDIHPLSHANLDECDLATIEEQKTWHLFPPP